MDFLFDLPLELSLLVLDKLPARDLCICSHVSKFWRFLANDEIIWDKLIQRYKALVLSAVVQAGCTINTHAAQQWHLPRKSLFSFCHTLYSDLRKLTKKQKELFRMACITGDTILRDFMVKEFEDEWMFKEGALAGSLETIKLLEQVIGPWSVPLVCYAAKSGSISLLEYVSEVDDIYEFDDHLKLGRAVLESGNLNCIKWVLQRRVDFPEREICYFAARSSNLAFLKWAVLRFSWSHSASMALLEFGDIKCIKWALNFAPIVEGRKLYGFSDEPFDLHFFWRNAMSFAAIHDHIDVLRWLRTDSRFRTPSGKYRCSWFNCIETACLHGSVQCLHYAIRQGVSISYQALGNAVNAGHIHLVKFLLSFDFNDREWKQIKENLCTDAAQAGEPEILCYLHSICHLALTSETGDAAASSLETFKYCLSHHCPCTPRAIVNAVFANDLEIVSVASKNQIPWNENATRIAYELERYQILKLLVESGCPCSENVTQFCRRLGFHLP